MIVVDSREKRWEHIQTYFERNKIVYRDKIKLDAGDYFNTRYPYVVIDRKSGLDEVCSNLIPGKENYHRFVKECRRAFKRHIRLIVLIEKTSCKTIEDVVTWQSKYSRFNGEFLIKEMKRISYMYGVEWVFCKKNQTAEEILRLTHYER